MPGNTFGEVWSPYFDRFSNKTVHFNPIYSKPRNQKKWQFIHTFIIITFSITSSWSYPNLRQDIVIVVKQQKYYEKTAPFHKPALNHLPRGDLRPRGTKGTPSQRVKDLTLFNVSLTPAVVGSNEHHFFIFFWDDEGGSSSWASGKWWLTSASFLFFFMAGIKWMLWCWGLLCSIISAAFQKASIYLNCRNVS